MENPNENIISLAMKAGLTLGLVSFFLSLARWFMPHSIIVQATLSLISCIAVLYCIFYYTSKYDKKVLNGTISYGKAYIYGIYIFVFASMILAILYYLVFLIDPDFVNQIKKESIQFASQLEGLSEADQEALEQIKTYSAKDFTLSILQGFSCLGVFVCLITSIFFRKKKETPKEELK